MKKTLHRILILLLVPGLIPGLLEPALSPVPMLSLNGWVANFHPWETTKALKRFSVHFNELSIFGVGAHQDGHLAPEHEFIRHVMRTSHQLNPDARVLVTVTNYRPGQPQDKWLLRHWLGSPDSRADHIKELLAVVGRADGLDIDYENLSPDDGPRYATFIHALGKALHARKKVLTITVEHHLFESGNLPWKTLIKDVDRVRIMAYQYHYDRTAAGAVAPPNLVRLLARRALKQIPAEKLEIALPLYGFDWTAPGKGKVLANLAAYQQLTHKPGARVFRDPVTHAARLQYAVTQGTKKQKRVIRHEVWFEDAESFAYKVNLLRKLGIEHVGIWHLASSDLTPLFR